MSSTELSSSALKSKFRGCLIGSLIGDCIGNQFDELVRWRFYKNQQAKLERLTAFMNKLMNGEQTKTLQYTDDTEMTIGIASSLADNGELNAKHMAERFTTDFFNQKVNRCYGEHVRVVFSKFKETNYEDVFLPARQQFRGTGSYGNGAAMRVAPIALFGNSRGEEYIMDAAKESALLTHYHPNGYRGAILQCLAVNAALELDSSQELNPISFIDSLLKKMEEIEGDETSDQDTSALKSISAFFRKMVPFRNYFGDMKPYCESLKMMKQMFLKNWEDISSEEIAESLGNGSDISALKSVPTAIYSFLRGLKPLKDYETSNPFLRTIFFAVSVGGDTDTIGAMAGAIAGAYYGEDIIPDVTQKPCESIDEIISLADKLFEVSHKEK